MKKITRIYSLLQALECTKKKFRGDETWWRGQPEDLPLLPGIYRPGLSPKENPNRLEKDLARRFLLGARIRHNFWPEGDHVLQLAMMQHYRLPTRLLDWTESPLYALYFAVQGGKNTPGTLWALSPASLNNIYFQKKLLLSPYYSNKDEINEVHVLFEVPFLDHIENINKTAATIIPHVDVRQAVQLSVFTIHGSKEPLNEHEKSSQFLLKFQVPAESKKSLQEEIIDFGVRDSNLFPDLENLACELKNMAIKGNI